MDSLTFPQPITYISKIEVNSTDKNASGFYDQLNQSQYDALLQFKEALTKDNIIQDSLPMITFTFFAFSVRESSI